MYGRSRTRSASFRLSLIGALTLAGCGRIQTTPYLDQPAGRSVITQDQIPYANAETAYDVVEHLRPQFFISTAGRSLATERLVYINGLRAGGLEVLRGIPSDRVQEIRLLGAGEATMLLGGGHPSGALMIKLRRGWQPVPN